MNLRIIVKIVAYIGIVVLVAPSIFYLAGKMELETVKKLMVIATILWFGASAFQVWYLDKKIKS
ncbi:MAG: hypothetical protein P8016_01785 [Sedimentisphaerales bacterium]